MKCKKNRRNRAQRRLQARTRDHQNQLQIPDRIENLSRRLNEVARPVDFWMDKNLPLEVQEWTLRSILACEEREQGLRKTTSIPPLEFPDPEGLSDQELHDLLWVKIRQLAERRIFLQRTDHLSDRELYDFFRQPEFREATTEVIPPNSSENWDILGGCSEEDFAIMRRYYPDDYRMSLSGTEDEPEEEWEPEPVPYPRQDRLPKPHWM